MREHEKPWSALSVDDVAQLFAGAPFRWWIAGGYALEMAVGRSLRPHADIDVLILRLEHIAVHEFLNGWDCWAADPPGTLRAWDAGEELADSVHDVWCRKAAEENWCLQLMIDESDGGDWVSRRGSHFRVPLENITCATPTGIPYLAPHIQLFYKAKGMREKDEVDFDAVLTAGVAFDKNWLYKAIRDAYGDQHPWLIRLSV